VRAVANICIEGLLCWEFDSLVHVAGWSPFPSCSSSCFSCVWNYTM